MKLLSVGASETSAVPNSDREAYIITKWRLEDKLRAADGLLIIPELGLCGDGVVRHKLELIL